jgi:hypothetical protein
MRKLKISPQIRDFEPDEEYNSYAIKTPSKAMKMPLKLKPTTCLRCLNHGYYEDSKGTARFCPDCLEQRGDEQMGIKAEVENE